MEALVEVKTILDRPGPRKEHSHDEHSVTLIWKGSTVAQASGEGMEACAGQLVLISAGTPHLCLPLDTHAWAYTLLLLSPGASPILDSILAAPGNSFIALDAELDPMLALAHASEKGEEAKTLHMLDSLLNRIAIKPRNCPKAVTRNNLCPRKSQLIAVADRIERQSDEEQGLEELAASAGMDKFAFAKAFKAGFGMSPHRYILNTRINKAKAMLRAGKSPSFAAAELGFCDQSHFSRAFEKAVGLAPGAYSLMTRKIRGKIVQD